MDSSQTRDETTGRHRVAFNGSPSCTYPPKARTTLRHKTAVQKALGVIEQRIQDRPTLGELASVSGLSRTYFSCVFKNVVGMCLQDYLSQVRMRKAKDLLNRVDLTIKQIAHTTGFKDPNYFSRTFKKGTGFNPTSWRVEEILICVKKGTSRPKGEKDYEIDQVN